VSRVACSPVPGFVPAPIYRWQRPASPFRLVRCATKARTFTAYERKGRQTERATFAASYSTATTRPALSNASKVVSTKWHATFALPTQVAEPNKLTTNTYNAKGMLTGQSWTATTDATGAAKFNALKTGSTYATGWGYNANSLNTTKVDKIDAVEVARWTYQWNAAGVPIRVTDKDGKYTRVTALDAHGRPTAGTANASDATFTTQYDPRGRMVRHSIGTDYIAWRYGPTGNLIGVEASTGVRAEITYTPLGDLQTVQANGQLIYPPPAAASTVTSASSRSSAAVAPSDDALSSTAVSATQSASSSSNSSSTGPASNTIWGSSEVGVTGNAFVGGASFNAGLLVNAATRESCPYVSLCFRGALGILASAGGKIGAQLGPRCGKDWSTSGTQVQAVGDVVTPAGGVGASVGVGDGSLTGLGAGVGPGWGLGFAFGLEFCWLYVNPQACKNTPCECRAGGSR
jgi:hypothetical protein